MNIGNFFKRIGRWIGLTSSTLPDPQTPGLTFIARGTGTQLVRYTESTGTRFQFKTGHGFYRFHTVAEGVVTDLRTTGLTLDTIEMAIVRDIEQFRSTGGMVPHSGTPTFKGPLERIVNVEGFRIGYRAVESALNLISVGTYFLET